MRVNSGVSTLSYNPTLTAVLAAQFLWVSVGSECAIRLKNVLLVFPDSLLGQVSVPFHLAKMQPKGQQTFALMTKDQVTGSLTTEVN